MVVDQVRPRAQLPGSMRELPCCVEGEQHQSFQVTSFNGAKIGSFSLANLFPETRTTPRTRVAGTPAPWVPCSGRGTDGSCPPLVVAAEYSM